MTMEEEKKIEFPVSRLFLTLILMAVAIFVCMLGTFMPVDVKTANETAQEFEKAREYIVSVPYVFGNNFMHCLIMFIPMVGVAYGMFIMFNTGYIIEMLAVAQGIPAPIAFISLFLLPFTWMEFICYSIAMGQSIILTFKLFKGKIREKFNETYRWITLCAVILLISALIEVVLILTVGS